MKRRRRIRRKGSSRVLRDALSVLFAVGAFFVADQLAGRTAVPGRAEEPTQGMIACQSPDITDGDTFRCAGLRIRLASIDAPELSACRKGRVCTPGDPVAAKAYLEGLTRGAVVTCRQTDIDRYGRTVALCAAQGRDLSCAMVAAGHAVERYGVLSCP